MTLDLEQWLPDPTLRTVHSRESDADGERLWDAARTVRLADTALLGRLIRWRIPGTQPELSFDELFRTPPFVVLDGARENALVSGLVGRIWTLRRDYPTLAGPEEFVRWSRRGTAKVVFANWVQPAPAGRSALVSEVRVSPIGSQGRIGVAAVRPLVSAFHNLIGSDGIEQAVRRAAQR
jgi:hypothetical protein